LTCQRSNDSTSALASLVSFRTACAWSRLSQNPGAAEISSSSVIRLRLRSTSKMPPELGQFLLELAEASADRFDVDVLHDARL